MEENPAESSNDLGRLFNFVRKNFAWLVAAGIVLILFISAWQLQEDSPSYNESLETAIPPNTKCIPEPLIPNANTEEKIAVIRIYGVIGDSMGVNFTVAKLRKAAANPEFKAIILAIESPGGGVTESDTLWNEVMKVKVSSKPIVAFFDNMAASGAYYLSAPADKIIISPSSLTGSIGVYFQSPNFAGLMDKVGVKMVTIKSAKNKDLLSPYRPIQPEEEAIIQSIVDELYGRFVTVVSQGRKMDKEKVRELADGRIYSAKQALNNGLVDEIGYFEDAVRLAQKLCGLPDASPVEIKESFGPVPFGFSQKSALDKKMILEKLFLQSGFYYLDPQLLLMYLNNK